ncbi:hypothetical protein C8J57DRAFT_1719613 [Mycena rebaudengoi]|nr:hypothetical protein C8J57DRAFT_1719613 [Mycena rebaudengoi]
MPSTIDIDRLPSRIHARPTSHIHTCLRRVQQFYCLCARDGLAASGRKASDLGLLRERYQGTIDSLPPSSSLPSSLLLYTPLVQMSQLANWIALFTILISATLIILRFNTLFLKGLLQLQRSATKILLDAKLPINPLDRPCRPCAPHTAEENNNCPSLSPRVNHLPQARTSAVYLPLTDEPTITSPNSPVILPVAISGNSSAANHRSGLNRLDLAERVELRHLSRIDTVNGQVNATFVAGNQTRNITHNYYHRAATLPPNVPQTPLFPEMPDSLRDILHAHLFLLEILGTTMVFRGIPSVLQIARVHGRQWDEVVEALRLISPYLDGMDEPVQYSSSIKLSANLRHWLSDRAQSGNLYIKPLTYHAKVARWCLVGNMTYDPRNISYAADNWAYHLGKSDPSPELCRALRESSLPFRPASHKKLPQVIRWLETSNSPQEELMTLLRSRHKEMESRLHGGIKIEVMGGAASMILTQNNV